MKKLITTLLLLLSFTLTYGQTAKDFIDNGVNKLSSNNYQEAINNFTKAIEMNPDRILLA